MRQSLGFVLVFVTGWTGPMLVALPALMWTTAVSAQRGYHVDSRIGFKLRLPVKWRRWPAEKDRRFLTGHYVSTRTWPIKGSQISHRPVLRILVLPKLGTPKQAPSKAAPSKQASSSAATPAVTKPVSVVEFYADYQDYLGRNLSGTLTYSSGEKGESDGVSYTEYQIRRRQNDLTYRLTVRVYEFETHRVAVEFMVLDVHAAALKQRLRGCFRSFRRVPIEAAADSDPWRPPLWVRDPERWRQLSRKDRLLHRGKCEAEFVARVHATVAPMFKVRDSKHFVIISSADARFTTEIMHAADACMEWCHAHLLGVSEEAVTKAVVRVFGSARDYWMYRARSRRASHYVPGIREIIVAPGRRPPRELTGLSGLTQGILHHYLYDKDPDLHRHLPRWIRAGLKNYLRLSKLERGKFVLGVSDYEKKVIRGARRAKSIETVQRILTQTQAQKDETDRRLRYERTRVVRFVFDSLQNPTRSTVPANFIVDYLIAVRGAQRELGVGAWNSGGGKVPGLTDELAEKNAAADNKTRTKLLTRVNQAVCDWDPARWRAVHKAYDKFNRNP
jgi:hypothetical protein